MNETRKPGHRVALTRGHLDDLIPGDRVMVSSDKGGEFRWMVLERRDLMTGEARRYFLVEIPEDPTNGGIHYSGIYSSDGNLTLTPNGIRIGTGYHKEFRVEPGSERYKTITDLLRAELED